MLSLWSSVLLGSVAIGLFLLTLLLTGRKSNPQARYLFSTLLAILVASNFDNWLFASGLWNNYPMLVGFSRGSILLIGPLIYLYSRSIVLPDFRLSVVHLLHLVPYMIVYGFFIPYLYPQSVELKRATIPMGLKFSTPMGAGGRLVFSGYVLQIAMYLWIILRQFRKGTNFSHRENFIVSTGDRLAWIKRLSIIFSLGLSLLMIPLIWAILSGSYYPQINYTGTTIYSLLIYFVGVSIVRSEHLVLPGFAKKYQSLQVTDEERRDSLTKLNGLMVTEKIFLDPALTMGKVAEAVGIPSGYLSRLVNEEFGKSFPDYVNSLRVDEFKRLASDEKYRAHSVYGLALEVGFNSKSSFNSAFKKFTGKTPSDFKKS